MHTHQLPDTHDPRPAMTYPEAIKYLEAFVNYEKITAYPYKESYKLERIKGFLSSIGNPQDGLKIIHVAGTKGKGSTCAFIAYILREAGFKTGLYTSPHLSDFRERIRVLSHKSQVTRSQDFEGMISREDLTSLVKRLRPCIEKFNRSCEYGSLSFFEIYTSLAFVYFKEKKADFVVLETGLGGRLDATNASQALVSVITPLSYEHTQKLGSTLRQIASEKAGIIKKFQGFKVQAPGRIGAAGAPPLRGFQGIVISAPQKKEAAQVIRKRAKDIGAKLYEVGAYQRLKTPLLGEHQLVNAAVAIEAIKALRNYGVFINDNAIRKGISNTRWPGRCEVISKNPFVILDGAQNIASAKALKKTIQENFKYNKLILVLGISQDKDIKGICRELKNLADKVILTKANNPRAAQAAYLARFFKGKQAIITKNIKEAKKNASNLAASDDLILACGSLFVVGEYRDDKKQLF